MNNHFTMQNYCFYLIYPIANIHKNCSLFHILLVFIKKLLYLCIEIVNRQSIVNLSIVNRNMANPLHSSPIPEVPKLANFTFFAWHSALRHNGHDILTLSKIEGCFALPESFVPPTYALEFVTKGSVMGKVNDHVVPLTTNSCVFWLADHVMKDVQTSPDCEIYILGFTAEFADALNIHIPLSQFSQLLMRPVWQITDLQMRAVLRYIELLHLLIDDNKPTAVLNMVRSLIYYLAEDTTLAPQQSPSLTRAEQICGQFLSLVELHCREQHAVEWYARQMALAPKYLSNVLKQTMDISPNACIDRALIRQAKSLLSSTSLSIQQISDRLGFLNQSHFGTFFRRHTGTNPSAYKTASR